MNKYCKANSYCELHPNLCCNFCEEKCDRRCLDEHSNCLWKTSNKINKEENILKQKSVAEVIDKKYKISDLCKYFKKSRSYFIKKIKNKEIKIEKIEKFIYINQQQFDELKKVIK